MSRHMAGRGLHAISLDDSEMVVDRKSMSGEDDLIPPGSPSDVLPGSAVKGGIATLKKLVKAICGRSGALAQAEGGAGAPLHFHSVKRRLENEWGEVAESVRPESIAVDALCVYLQSTIRFPSWTSRVRSPSPAPSFQ